MNFSISIQTILLPNQTPNYQQVLEISTYPQGPLNKLVKKQQNPALSPFENNKPKCILIIYSSFEKQNPLHPNDLPWLGNFLQNNNYTIDYQMTKSLKNQIFNGNLVWCVYYNPTNKHPKNNKLKR